MPNRQKATHRTLGHNVRKARKAQKLTIEQLAKTVKMKPDYIRDIESGKITDVPADVLFQDR